MNEDKCHEDEFMTFSASDQGHTHDEPIVCPEIGGYTLGHQLGVGGMGVVWRAIQISTNREVALKVTNTAVLGSKKAIARFEREVELAARLEHPNVARVYDSGIHQNVYYYAMELVEGLPLDQYVRKHQLSTKQVVQLMHTICTAMQYAHQRGVIHRDLKPSNILVTDDGQPHILDFGLAKDFLSDESGRTVSLDGDILGTPAFMSPEQASGKLDEIDTRSDIYSMGIIAYYLLTRRWPYNVDVSHYELLTNIREREPERPSKIEDHFNKDLEAILIKTLEKNPDKRYQSALAMADDIQNWLEQRAVNARSLSTRYLLKKYIQRHRMASFVVASLVVILFSSGFVGFYSLRQVRIQKNEMDRRDQAYADEQIERHALDVQLAFKMFLANWHVGNQVVAQQYLTYPNKEASREVQAAHFLLDKNTFAAKRQGLSDDCFKENESFWCFIFGEQHLRDRNFKEALSAYQQSQQTAQQSQKPEDWFHKIVSSRINGICIESK